MIARLCLFAVLESCIAAGGRLAVEPSLSARVRSSASLTGTT